VSGGWVGVGSGAASATSPPGQDLKSLLAAAGIKDVTVESDPGGWSWVKKARPSTMGEWTHASAVNRAGRRSPRMMWGRRDRCNGSMVPAHRWGDGAPMERSSPQRGVGVSM